MISIMRMPTTEIVTNLMHKGNKVPNDSVIQTDKASTDTCRQSKSVIGSTQYTDVGNSSAQCFTEQCMVEIDSGSVPCHRARTGPIRSHD